MAERKIHDKVLEHYVNTIWAIADSPWIQWFVIGYTANSGRTRFAAYRARGFDGLVLLADHMTQGQALQLEEKLQEICKAGPPRGLPYRRKYHPSHRNLPYYRSAGQGSPNPSAKIHSVYMAWSEKER